MAKAGYSTDTEGTVASAAATTAKSILGVSAPAQFGCDLKGFSIDFDGVTASEKPVLVELCGCTFATQPPGTASTSTTVDQEYGRAITAGFTAAKNWTTEPTVITVLRAWDVDPNKGLLIYDYPLGESPDKDRKSV